MAAPKRKPSHDIDRSKLLHDGDRMSQPQFHALYEKMPDGYRAELIGGVVCEPSPVGWAHSKSHGQLIGTVSQYANYIPGVEFGIGSTVILGEEDEVQPDLVLRIMPGFGGRSRDTKGTKVSYVAGAPELVAEVAHTSHSIDMRIKKERYSLAGVLEYIVLDPMGFHWFDLGNGSELPRDEQGVIRSTVFPGLWIDSEALQACDYARSMSVLSHGMGTAEYKRFVESLERHV